MFHGCWYFVCVLLCSIEMKLTPFPAHTIVFSRFVLLTVSTRHFIAFHFVQLDLWTKKLLLRTKNLKRKQNNSNSFQSLFFCFSFSETFLLIFFLSWLFLFCFKNVSLCFRLLSKLFTKIGLPSKRSYMPTVNVWKSRCTRTGFPLLMRILGE